MKIIVKTIFGSHLYGTNVEGSDIDYKVVYQDDLKNIILGNGEVVKRVGQGTEEECEYIELRKFLKDLINGQTYAVDMIFTPRESIVEKSAEWDLIRESRQKFLSKDCKSFIGYCVTQSKVYSDKGRKIRELKELTELVKDIPDNVLIGDIEFPSFVEHITRDFVKSGKSVAEEYIELHGKFFQKKVVVKRLKEFLEVSLSKYGNRGYLASETLKDWKAIYHAFRVIRELSELARTGGIKFPLKDAEELKQIRQGKWFDYKPERLEWEMNGAKADVMASNLQDKVDMDWFNDFVLKFYIN